MEYDIGVLIQVLNKLFKPGAQISEENVSKLVKYLTGMTDVVERELFIHVLQLWFTEAIQTWESSPLPAPGILSLTLNIAVFLSSQESSFVKLNKENIFDRFIVLLKTALEDFYATPDVGYVKLMSAFLQHKPGCQWILSTPHWSEIINLALNTQQDSDLTKECNNFIVKLIQGSISIDSDSCGKVIHVLISPILDCAQCFNKENKFDETKFIQTCSRTLDLLNDIGEIIHSSKHLVLYQEVTRAVEKYDFEQHCLEIHQQLNDEDAGYKVLNMLFLLSFIDSLAKSKGVAVMEYTEFLASTTKYRALRKLIFYHNTFVISNKIICNWIRYSVSTVNFCPRVRIKDKLFTTKEQFLYFQIYPILYVSMRVVGREYCLEPDDDQIRFVAMQKHFSRVLPAAFYHFYHMKSFFQQNFNFQDAIITLDNVMKCIPYYTKDEANIVLSICIYSYEDVSRINPDDEREIISDPERMVYLACIMKTIATFITEFDLNWQDSLETMTLMEITLAVLSYTEMNSNVIVNGLNLVGVAFSKKLSPNMALLTDQFDGDILEQLLSICICKLGDNNWEIKNAAIQVLVSVSNNVRKDFIVFKSMMFEHNLPVRISQMAVHNNSPEIRTSALKCLQEMAKVEDFWNDILNNCDIYDNVCTILFEDTDGNVRTAASELTSIIYEQYNLSTDDLLKFYDMMTYSAIEDEHAPTRKSALKFWRKVIDSHLISQGMIDGAFPEVTFSAETKRIVVLNEIEIKKRLVKVLHNLCETGCLFVLKNALADWNLEVLEAVESIVKKFVKLLKEFDVTLSAIEGLRTVSTNTPPDGGSDNSNASFNLENDLSTKVIGRQKLHPEDFLESVKDFFTPNEHDIRVGEFIDISAILGEILYDGAHENEILSDFKDDTSESSWKIASPRYPQ